MTSNTIYTPQSKFKPTYLYIKQHTITGKLYFGKTILKDPIKYRGSGTIWKRHIKKHGKEHIVTLWYELFTDKNEIQEFALSFSKDMNIVESTQWLNLIPETGLTGGMPPGIKLSEEHKQKLRIPKSEEHKQKLRIAQTGMICSAETSLKISLRVRGEGNPMFGKIGINNPNTGRIKTDAELIKLRGLRGKQKNPRLAGWHQENVTCPHCSQIGGKSNMTRFHFNNCKMNPNTTKVEVIVKPLGPRGKQKNPRKYWAKHQILTCPHCHKIGGKNAMKRYHFNNCKFKVD